MNRTAPTTDVIAERQQELALADTTIRDLVDAYPETMGVLAPLGIDLCCGGAHPLGEALDLHGIPRAGVLEAIAGVVAAKAGRGA
jgi:iron-sulfur cluster repair protein YtfE (RIC family)